MRIDQWTYDLPRRLALAGDIVDDVAQSDCLASEEHRERLFSVEAQIWRIARTTSKAVEELAELVPFLKRSLRAVRANVRLCLSIPVSTEVEGLELLERVGRDLDEAISELEALTRTDDRPLRLAAGGGS
jgi:hypothetical protein